MGMVMYAELEPQRPVSPTALPLPQLRSVWAQPVRALWLCCCSQRSSEVASQVSGTCRVLHAASCWLLSGLKVSFEQAGVARRGHQVSKGGHWTNAAWCA